MRLDLARAVPVAIATVVALCLAEAACGVELVTPLLAGVTIGAPLAKAPPAGTYAGTTLLYLRGAQVDAAGRRTDVSLRELEVAQSLLVATDLRILGARYSVSAVQPVKRPETTTPEATNPQVGAYNTILSPLNLSWDLGGGLSASYGHSYYLPDGTYSALEPKVANGFFTFEQKETLRRPSAQRRAVCRQGTVDTVGTPHLGSPPP